MKETVVVLSEMHGRGGGGERALSEFISGWPREGKLQLTVLAPPESSVYTCALDCGIPTMPFLNRRDAMFSNVSAALREVRAIPPRSVIHSWTQRTLECATLMARLTGGIASCSFHLAPTSVSPARSLMTRTLSRYCAGFVGVSRTVAGMLDRQRLHCPVRVIYNGVRDLGSRKNVSGRTTIGFLGMHLPEKGFLLMDAWIRATAGADTVWRLYGEVHPDLKPGLGMLLAKYPEHIVVCGHREPAEIFSEIDILVHPSLLVEAFGMVLIEAASAGIPAVASCRGASPEIVIDGETGWLFDPDCPDRGLAQLVSLVDDCRLRARMGETARRVYLDKFTVARMVDLYASFWTNECRQ